MDWVDVKTGLVARKINDEKNITAETFNQKCEKFCASAF